jgi:hypothetical protein
MNVLVAELRAIIADLRRGQEDLRQERDHWRAALKRDPRTADWQWKKTRKSFMRAVGREKLK